MLSVCLIVKDELKVIARCLESVKLKMGDLVDDIIVVDTGSTDGTREMLRTLDCKSFDYKWCDDFSKARNFSIDKAKNDWVFILDADEFIVECDLVKLKYMLEEQYIEYIGEVDIWNYGDVEGLTHVDAVVPRLFNRKEVVYTGIIHEEPKMKNDKKVKLREIPILLHHTGYINEIAEEKDKANRNIELIKKSLEQEESMYLTMHLAKSYMRKGDFQNAIENLEKVIFNEESVKYEYYSKSVSEYVRALLNVNQHEVGMVCENFWERCFVDSSYVYYMGHVYMRNKHYEKAVDCFLEILNRENAEISNVMALYSLGQLFATVEMYEESLKYFEMCGDYNKAVQNIIEIKKILNTQ